MGIIRMNIRENLTSVKTTPQNLVEQNLLQIHDRQIQISCLRVLHNDLGKFHISRRNSLKN